MVHVIVRHQVADYNKWKQAFDAHLNHRMASGETGSRVLQSVDDPRDVTLVLDWQSVESARRFMASDELRTTMKEAGVLGEPEIHYVQDVVTVRRTAAD